MKLWSDIVTMFQPSTATNARGDPRNDLTSPQYNNLKFRGDLDPVYGTLMSIDYVPINVPQQNPLAHLVILEDNDAVIKMCIKGRSPALRHVLRTHRVDLDWLFERIMFDPCIFMRYLNTKEQIADVFTKGSFTAQTWQTLMKLAQIGVHTVRK